MGLIDYKYEIITIVKIILILIIIWGIISLFYAIFFGDYSGKGFEFGCLAFLILGVLDGITDEDE